MRVVASGRHLLTGLGAAALFAALPLAQAAAATTTTTFTVTANVQTTCSLTATNLNFGNYVGVVLDGTSTISALCSTGTPYNLGLDAGTATGATVTTRAMQGPNIRAAGVLLNYGLFQDAGHTKNWGETIATDTVTGTGTGASQPFTVYGQIPAGQFVASGEYQDIITVTLTF